MIDPLELDALLEMDARGITPCTYNSAHRRTRKTRGLSSTFTCIDCPATAAHWSYDGDSDVELTGTIQVKRDGHTVTQYKVWSPDPDDYSPRCISCHRKHDMTPEKVEQLTLLSNILWASSNTPRRRHATIEQVTIMAMFGLTPVQTADAMGIAAGTVNARIRQAKARNAEKAAS